MNYYQTSTFQKIYLEEAPLGKGGEGNVYSLLPISEIEGDYVAKIYHPELRNQKKLDKLKYLLDKPPKLTNPDSVIWVEDILYDRNENFVGYLMRKAKGAYNLSVLTSLKLSNKLDESWLASYSLHEHIGLQNRVKIALNLVRTLHEVHKSQQYILGDLKPENIRIDLAGNIELMDIDSCEIIEKNKVVFPADKLSLEYSPPERNKVAGSGYSLTIHWDRFSLAVIIYKLLLGLHPFTVTGNTPYKNLVSFADKIKAGLSPWGILSGEIEVRPKPHDNFYVLPQSVQALFKKTFNQGHKHPMLRPSAKSWEYALENFEVKAPIHQIPKEERIKEVILKGTYDITAKELGVSIFLKLFALAKRGAFALFIGLILSFTFIYNSGIELDVVIISLLTIFNIALVLIGVLIDMPYRSFFHKIQIDKDRAILHILKYENKQLRRYYYTLDEIGVEHDMQYCYGLMKVLSFQQLGMLSEPRDLILRIYQTRKNRKKFSELIGAIKDCDLKANYRVIYPNF